MADQILLINVHSSANAGDAALTFATLQQLEKHFPGCNLTLQVDDLESYQEAYRTVGSLYRWVRGADVGGNPKWNGWNLFWLFPATLLPVFTYQVFRRPFFWITPKSLRPMLQEYFDADLIVSKPGGFLYSSGMGLTLFIAVYTMALGIWAGKPLYLYPQSVGPLKHKWEYALMRWLVSHARIFMVREAISLEQLETCGVARDRVRLIPDTAFDFQTQADAGKWFEQRGLKVGNEPWMGMTVIQWGSQSKEYLDQARYEEVMAAAASHFIRNMGGKVVIFTQAWGPSESQDDRPAARRVAKRLTDLEGSVLLLDEQLPPDLLKSLYGKMDVLIGTRMHSNIFALSQGVPVLAIGYYHKTQGIMTMLGLQEWVIEITQIEEKKLLDMLDKLWNQRASLREGISKEVSEIAQKAGQAGVWVAEDFARRRKGGYKKPRVVQILHGLSIEGQGGGANRFGIELAQALNPDRFTRAVWALWDFGTEEERIRRGNLNDAGIEMFVAAPWNEQKPYQSWWQAYRALGEKLRETPAEILNSHSEFGDVPVLWFRLTKKGLKIVRTVHGGHYREWDRRPFRRFLLTNFLYPLFYDLEIGVGPRVVHELNHRQFGNLLKKESLFLPNAINLNRFSQLEIDVVAKRQSLNVPDGSFLIGTVGRLVEQKGYAYLLEAASWVVEKIPEAYFFIIGDGPLAEVLKEQASRAGLAERIIFAGMRQDVEALYACLDLFVSSSLWEGLPTVIMESMASGVPVVATDIPGSRDLIRHKENGWLVSPRNSKELAEGILAAFQSPGLRQDFAQRGKNDIGYYSIQTVAVEYATLYEDMLAR